MSVHRRPGLCLTHMADGLCHAERYKDISHMHNALITFCNNLKNKDYAHFTGVVSVMTDRWRHRPPNRDAAFIRNKEIKIILNKNTFILRQWGDMM